MDFFEIIQFKKKKIEYLSTYKNTKTKTKTKYKIQNTKYAII